MSFTRVYLKNVRYLTEEVEQQFAKVHGSNVDQSPLRKTILLPFVRLIFKT